MNKLLIIFSLVAVTSITACEFLDGLGLNAQLTQEEIVEGLKTALNLGTDTSVTNLSAMNGFYKDELVKILLPPEAQVIYEYAQHPLMQAFGAQEMLEDVVMSMNRAAEDASKEARPIFTDAITSLSITDGLAILKGTNPAGSKKSDFDSSAATHYLESTTRAQLYDAFSPKVGESLKKPLIGQFSTSQLWTTLTTKYNQVAGLLGWKKVEQDLGGYVTDKALNGMFTKVAKEETEIRRNPYDWGLSILHKVFGDEGG